jgi:hypothetical protein
MKEEAVSPIVAFMLILMVVVSFISVLNAYYIPPLKQQAEIEHLNQVEKAFLTIDSDIHRSISFKDYAETKIRIPLGGGDVFFSPIRSSGLFVISNEKELGRLEIGTYAFHFTLANITYRPVGNFWINQGYYWGNGTVNITKGNYKSTWLEITDIDDEKKLKTDFFNVLLRISIEDKIVNSSSNTLENITLIVNNMTINPNNRYVSSNGFGVLSLKNLKNKPIISNPVNEIKFYINSTLTDEEKDIVNNSFNNISIFNYKNKKDPQYDPNLNLHIFKFDPPINITIEEKPLVFEIIQ